MASYADQIYQMISGVGDPIVDNRNRATQVAMANRDYARQLGLDQYSRATNERDFDFRKAEAARDNARADAGLALQRQMAEQGKVSPGYRQKPDGTWEAIPGGPAAPAFGAAGSEVPLGPDGKADPLAQKDFLAKLDPGTASLVKGIADYQMDISKVTSLRGDQRQKLAQIVSQYDPTFDMTQYGARAAMRKSITSGPYSQALNSANLVIQHLDALKRAIPDLGNGSLTPYNTVKNFVMDQGGSAAISKFNTAADAAASELAKVFKGTGASSEEEIKNWRHNLSINGSPEQIKQSIDTAIGDLLKSRIDTINAQYQAAMGRPASFTFLTPHSRQVLKDIGIDPADLDPNAGDEAGAPASSNSGNGGNAVDFRSYFGGQ